MNKKIVFITGVSRGIGLELAKCFLNDGYFVIGTSRSEFDLSSALDSKIVYIYRWMLRIEIKFHPA